MINSIITDDSCYRLSVAHRKDTEYPSITHYMYTDTFKEAINYLASVYHVFGIIDHATIEGYEK